MKKNLVIFVITAVTMVGCTKVIRNPESEHMDTSQEVSQAQEMPTQPMAQAPVDTAASAAAAEEAKAKDAAKNAQEVANQVSDQLRFSTASTVLKPEAVQGLKQLGGIVSQSPNVTVKVNGYTDNTGSKEYNEKLSIERAQAVKSTLAASGVPSDRISVVGHSSSDPVASNSTAYGRAQNRRAEVEVVTG